MLKKLSAFVAVVVATLATLPSAQAETITRERATAPFEGGGLIFQVSPDSAYFVGAFRGVMFSEGEDGSLNQIDIACPTNLTIDLSAGAKMSGTGHCVFQVPGTGDVLYSAFKCDGNYTMGCIGELKITGGEGRFDGATGGATLIAKSTLNVIAESALAKEVAEAATGFLVFDGISITTK